MPGLVDPFNMSTTWVPPYWVPHWIYYIHCTSNGLYNDWRTHGSPLRASINCFSCKNVSLTRLNSCSIRLVCPLHLQFQIRLYVCSLLFWTFLDLCSILLSTNLFHPFLFLGAASSQNHLLYLLAYQIFSMQVDTATLPASSAFAQAKILMFLARQ